MVFILLTASNLMATQHKTKRKVDWEKYKAQKISFITEQLELDSETAQAFWPVYNAFEKKLINNMKDRRTWDKEIHQDIDSIKEKDLLNMSWRMSELAQKEADMRKEANKQFLEILTPKQVVKLYQAEQMFREQLLHKYGRKSREGNSSNP